MSTLVAEGSDRRSRLLQSDMISLLPFLLSANPARAFRLDGHQALTEATVAEVPQVAPWEATVARANRNEDLGLREKWVHSSHYYDPTGAYAGGRRQTSAARVNQLNIALDAAIEAGDADQAWDVAGHLLHHIQDMASPLHVVPVPHGLRDGFERQPLLLGSTATRKLAPVEASTAHHLLAVETRELVATPNWQPYWAPAHAGFGDYGELGRSFAGESPEEAALLADRADAAVAYGAAFLRHTAARLQDGASAAQPWARSADDGSPGGRGGR
jgi:hypothetical protein